MAKDPAREYLRKIGAECEKPPIETMRAQERSPRPKKAVEARRGKRSGEPKQPLVVIACCGRRLLPYFAVVVLSALYLFPYSRVLSHHGDEGISVLNAARVLQGEIPGRDFIEAVPLGEFYWLALFFRLLGTSIVTAHAELLLVGIALSVLAFYLARRAGSQSGSRRRSDHRGFNPVLRTEQLPLG
jgi:hypothetical protein